MAAGFDVGIELHSPLFESSDPEMLLDEVRLSETMSITTATSPTADLATAWFKQGGLSVPLPFDSRSGCNSLAGPSASTLDYPQGAFTDGAAWLDGQWVRWD